MGGRNCEQKNGAMNQEVEWIQGDFVGKKGGRGGLWGRNEV